jgi:hypothetical protein
MISRPEFPTHQALKEPKMGMCKPRKNWDMGISWEENGGNRKSPRPLQVPESRKIGYMFADFPPFISRDIDPNLR